MPKMISEEQKKKLLSFTPEYLTAPVISQLFTPHAKTTVSKDGKYSFETVPAEFNLRDRMILKAHEYINEKEVDTNVGKFLFNKILIEPYIAQVIPNHYYNKTFTKKSFDEISKYCSDAIMSDKLDINALAMYLKAFEFYGLKLCTALSPSFTPKLVFQQKEVAKAKEKVIKEIEAKGKDATLADYAEAEDEILKTAKDAIGNDPGMTLYDSGSRGSFDNDQKINTMIVGPVKNTMTDQYDFMTSDMTTGLKKEDISKAGNMVVAAAYPKAKGTAVGGYLTKQFYAVYQSIVLGDTEDCGSTWTLQKKLTKDNVETMMYQYMVDEKGKYICLEPDNASQYIGKTVRFRSPMGCKSPQICHICAGDRFHKLGLRNVGLTTGKISNDIMNANMKKFHEIKVHMNEVNPDKLLLDE